MKHTGKNVIYKNEFKGKIIATHNQNNDVVIVNLPNYKITELVLDLSKHDIRIVD